MSGFSVLLLVAFIAVFGWIKLGDKRKWETVYESNGLHSGEVQRRESYLKGKGIHCRLKNYLPGTTRMAGMGGSQISNQSTIQLQVHKKESDHAFKLLSDLNREKQK